jgi:PAS domain S-box-containing protein
MPHALLRRQLRRLDLARDRAPSQEQWGRFLDLVSQVYADSDEERYTSERAFTIASREMQDLHERLQVRSQDALAVEGEKLSRSVTMLSATMNTMTDGVLVVGPALQVIAHNRRFAELWRLPAEAIASGDGERLLASMRDALVDPDGFMARVNHLVGRPSESGHDELELLDGRYFERHSAPVVDPRGVHARMWLFRDVTVERRARAQLQEATRFLDSIIENLPDMVFVKDATELRFVRFNRAGEALLGHAREQLLGRSDRDFFPPAEADFFQGKDREVLAGRTMVDIPEEVISTSERGPRILHTKKIPILDEHGVPRYLLGISRDITGAKRVESELRAAKELAERASQAKTEFLANMSHELRTPLNAIVGFARVLTANAADRDDGQRDYLDYILRASEHMLSLVNDLLDLRRVEASAGFLELDAHRLLPLAEAATRMVAPMFSERGHAFACRYDEPLPLLRCDARALVQVLTNLLSNAAKYTPDGGRIELSGSAEPGGLRISVRDNGVGIAPADQARLFTYFTQVGAKHTHHMRGSGVGLALTRALVERMGGTLEVESAIGSGSAFHVRLPLAEEAAPCR